MFLNIKSKTNNNLFIYLFMKCDAVKSMTLCFGM